MIDKKTDEKEAFELKQIYHYPDKRTAVRKITQFKTEDTFNFK